MIGKIETTLLRFSTKCLIQVSVVSIQDYAKPMGVATYRMNSDMPEKLREALPDVEDLKKLL